MDGFTLCRFMHQPQERILTGTMPATQPPKQEMSTHQHSTCKVSELKQDLPSKPPHVHCVEKFSLTEALLVVKFG